MTKVRVLPHTVYCPHRGTEPGKLIGQVVELLPDDGEGDYVTVKDAKGVTYRLKYDDTEDVDE